MDSFSGLTCQPSHVAIATYPAGATFGPRHLKDFEFVWIIQGDVVWECDGVSHPAPEGTLILARPGHTDGFLWDVKRATRHGFVHFSLQGSSTWLPPLKDWPLLRQLGAGDVIPQLFQHIGWLQAHQPPHWQRMASATLEQALVAFVTGSSGTVSQAAPDTAPLVSRAMADIQRRWANGGRVSIPVEALARGLGVSRGHLIRSFTAELGIGPAEAIRLLRLERAAYLLGRTNLQVQEVAEDVGFPNAFHFSKLFHQVYGYAPRTFRKRHIDGLPVYAKSVVRVRNFTDMVWATGDRPS